jgi:hypothetical protein
MRLESRRAEAFAAALADPAAPRSDEDQVFIELVERLGALDIPEMRPDFGVDLRARLLAEAPAARAATRQAKRRPARVIPLGQRSRRRRLAPAVAIAAMLLGTATAVGVASQRALPGDALYPVKRAIEHVEVALSIGDHSEGDRLLNQARTRLDEIRDLTERDGNGPKASELVNDTLSTFRSEANDGAGRLMNDYRDHGNADSIRDIRDFTASSIKQLASIVPKLAPATTDSVRQTVLTLQSLDSKARSLCLSCSSRPVLVIPDLLHALMTLPPQLVPGQGTPTTPHRINHGSAKATPGSTSNPAPGGLPTLGLPDLGLPTLGGGSGGGQSTDGGGVPLTSQIPGLPSASVSLSLSLSTVSIPLPTITLPPLLPTGLPLP